MKTLFLTIGLLAISLTGNTQISGSATALDFSANIGNANHVDLGNLSNLNTNDFSFECWMKVNNVVDDPAFFSNKDWDSGNNTGLVFDVQGNGQNMKFNFKDPNNSRKDLTIDVNLLELDWFHFAATMDRGGYFKVYINGIIQDSLDISSITGSFQSSYTYKLGQDGTGDYTWGSAHPRFDGSIDDVRIWNGVLTKQQIRDRMCLKLNGSEPSLYAYYPCNDASGTTLDDISASNMDGTLINSIAANWVTSGAALGDVSANTYVTNWSGITVGLNTANGNFHAQNIQNTGGVHVYKVNTQPNPSNGLTVLPGNNVYFGVFLADKSVATTYEIQLDYGSFGLATTNENDLILWNRSGSNTLWWSDYLADQNLTNNSFQKDSIGFSKEFYLGLVPVATCTPPSNPLISTQTASSCEVQWTSGGATHWNLQWGEQGFSLGNGIEVLNTTNNPFNFTGLTGNVYYDLYIQDTCSGVGSSSWIGPFTFYASICSAPTNLTATAITSSQASLTWTSGASLFDIEWGLPGFTQGAGIPVNGVTNPYVLQPLSPNTSYEYYVRSACDANSTSPWVGPYTFTTLVNTAATESLELDAAVMVFPNPATGTVNIRISQTGVYQVELIDLTGRVLSNVLVESSGIVQKTVDLSANKAGSYLLRISSAKGSVTKQLVVK